MAGVTARAAFDAAFDAMRYSFKWGLRTDCTVACDAFRDIHGVDPLSGCDDAYSTALGAARILKNAGGYRAWCNATLQLDATRFPCAGDLLLIESADFFGAALALYIAPGKYAAKTQAGMAISSSKIIGAWSWHS